MSMEEVGTVKMKGRPRLPSPERIARKRESKRLWAARVYAKCLEQGIKRVYTDDQRVRRRELRLQKKLLSQEVERVPNYRRRPVQSPCRIHDSSHLN